MILAILVLLCTGTYALLNPGVEKIHGLGDLSEYEKAALKAMMPELISQIEKGVEFAKGSA